MNEKKERESGIELLRILTMLGVVMLHYNDGRAFKWVAEGSHSQYILFFLESLSICAVDLFILISGYFLSSTQKRSLLKPFQLLFQLVFWREAIYLVLVLLQKDQFSMKSFLSKVVPDSYFIILYCALYIISPYINILLHYLSSQSKRYFIITILILFSVWTTAVDLAEEILGYEWMGLSTVTAWGSKQGFSIVNFSLLYCIGGYLRNPGLSFSKKKGLIALWLITVLLIFLWAIATQRLTRLELRSAWVYHNPLVILSAVLLFHIFKNMHFSNKIINNLAAASFTCFLIHGKMLSYIGIQNAVESSTPMMLLHIAVSIPIIYFISWLAYTIYYFATNWFFHYLHSVKFFKPKEII